MLALKLNPDNALLMEELLAEGCSLLDFCYNAIQCECIEVVHPKRLPYPYLLVIDESGLLKGLSVNPLASVLYETDKHGYPILGTALLMKEAMTSDGPDIVSLEESDIKPITAIVNAAVDMWIGGKRA